MAGVLVTGVLAIEGLLAVLALATHLPASVLLLNLPSLTLIAFCGVGLTLLTVFGVTWGSNRSPARCRPERREMKQNHQVLDEKPGAIRNIKGITGEERYGKVAKKADYL